MLVKATVTNLMPYLSSVGFSRSMSSLVATAVPLTSIAGRLGIGWLGDKIDRRRVIVLAFIAMSLGLLCFSWASNTHIWLIIPFIILFSVSYGGINSLRPPMVREYFGRVNFGTVFGLMMGINMVGSLVGPLLAGWVYDNWQSYQGIWLIFAGLPLIAMILILTIPKVSNININH